MFTYLLSVFSMKAGICQFSFIALFSEFRTGPDKIVLGKYLPNEKKNGHLVL
jgi:hypothetical protein